MTAATSSYISLPPPYTHIYSAGGPSGEVHLVNPSSGGFGEKVQQVLFVPEVELEGADKTRVALV
jgi:carboxy-cis,cis-muconate cyclase